MEDENLVNVNDVHKCLCNTTCSRKDGKKNKGCPCKTRGDRCNVNCKCGKKKKGRVIQACTNGGQAVEIVEQQEVAANAGTARARASAEESGRDGWIRMAEELDQADTDIREYLGNLSREDLISIIIETNNQGYGSIDAIKDALFAAQKESDEETAEEIQLPWCKCGKCKEMPTLVENKCCGRKKCVTLYEKFRKYCLDKDILTLNIKAWADTRAEEWNFETNQLRKAAYRQFILWKFGKLGKGNRRVVPSCVVLIVRDRFPSRDGTYMGYREN